MIKNKSTVKKLGKSNKNTKIRKFLQKISSNFTIFLKIYV